MKVRPRFAFIRDKIQVFLLGLLLGLVLGGGFFLLKLDTYVKQLAFYKSLTENKDKNDLDYVPPKTDSVKPVVKTVKKKTTTTETNNNQSSSDTSESSSSYVYVGNKNNDNIVVRTDEMLGEKNYPVANMVSKTSNDSTSNLQITPSILDIEFWISPLNYHGYKFSRNKLVLFGYSETDMVSVMKSENGTYIKCLTGVFKLEPCTEFRSMDKVTDESLLAKLK